MKMIGDAITRGRLAMAGRRSPWGGGNKGDSVPPTGGGAGPEPTPPIDPAVDPDEGNAKGPRAGIEPKPPAEPGPSANPKPGPRNPWLPAGEPPRRSASIEDIFRNKGPGKGPGGGSGGGGSFPRIPQRPGGKSWFPLLVGGLAVVWLFVSTTHMVGPKEQGIVTTFGKYSGLIRPGVSLTLPWPIQSVDVVDVTSIKRDTIPDSDSEKLMLTSDQNLVDLSYLVRWNIKDLKLYTFQLADPEMTVKEVAEAAMRASIAEVPLREAMGGSGRALIEQSMRSRMQAILDAYHSGVLIQGVEIKKADPPEKVIGAFQQVTAAQQDAQRDQSNAQAWAQQLTARSQGDAAAFDKVYEQYKLAPEVTRRRMYYETMERVLSNNDKVILEANGVNAYLPLPEIKRRAAAPDTAAAPAPGAQP